MAIARTGDDTRRLVVGLCNVAVARVYANDVAGAHPLTDVALALAQRTRNPTNLAFATFTAGEIRAETAPRDALPFLERAIELAQAARNRFVAGVAGLTQVSVAARVGDPPAALATYPPLVDHWRRLGTWTQQWTTIRTLVETPRACRQHRACDRAVRCAPVVATRRTTRRCRRTAPRCGR